MTTILIWLGSGFAFSVGVFIGAYLMNARWLKHGEEITRSEELLSERNEIGERQASLLLRIAEAIEARNS